MPQGLAGDHTLVFHLSSAPALSPQVYTEQPLYPGPTRHGAPRLLPMVHGQDQGQRPSQERPQSPTHLQYGAPQAGPPALAQRPQLSPGELTLSI